MVLAQEQMQASVERLLPARPVTEAGSSKVNVRYSRQNMVLNLECSRKPEFHGII
jgi:hypothetical protein